MTELAADTFTADSPAADLDAWTRRWSRQWWDQQAHLVHNPPGAFGELIAGRSVHLTPQSGWVAYGLLGSSEPSDHIEADAAISALLALQYDAPDAVFHGTFARFLEAPYPPAAPTMWEDYDPNWRQFVGTTLALMLEDFPDRLSEARRDEMVAAIQLACAGEKAEGRLGPSYANPALMHAWLDGWCGRRVGDDAQVERADRFAAAVVERFDRFGAFDEFNSPTYYGVDLYALALWRTFPPTARFGSDGERLEAAIWHEAALFHHAGLSNFCGPYTRSYGPDATRTLTLAALWIWGAFGREAAPLPDLEAAAIDHGHDLMAGPLIARLVRAPESDVDRASFGGFRGARAIRQELPGRRVATAALFEDVMIGAESSVNDWGGWEQFMPAVVHWRAADGIGVLWLVEPRQVQASVDGRRLALIVEGPGHSPVVQLLVAASECRFDGTVLHTDAMQVDVDATGAVIDVETVDQRLHRVTMTATDPHAAALTCALTFTATH